MLLLLQVNQDIISYSSSSSIIRPLPTLLTLSLSLVSPLSVMIKTLHTLLGNTLLGTALTVLALLVMTSVQTLMKGEGREGRSWIGEVIREVGLKSIRGVALVGGAVQGRGAATAYRDRHREDRGRKSEKKQTPPPSVLQCPTVTHQEGGL